jgi:hypothetical protein
MEGFQIFFHSREKWFPLPWWERVRVRGLYKVSFFLKKNVRHRDRTLPFKYMTRPIQKNEIFLTEPATPFINSDHLQAGA